jgi:heme/copper-type cytochrome/quinol oxidase subunit 2
MDIFVIIVCYFLIAVLLEIILLYFLYKDKTQKHLNEKEEEEYFDKICVISVLWPLSVLACFILLPFIIFSSLIKFIKNEQKKH